MAVFWNNTADQGPFSGVLPWQAKKLKEQHAKECKDFSSDQERKRPVRPKYSSDLLNRRRIEEYLVRQGEYSRAHVVKEAADCMENSEMQSTIAAFDVESRLKEHKMLNKQQQEMEALAQRGARGGAELKIQRLAETERRGQRFKNVLAVEDVPSGLVCLQVRLWSCGMKMMWLWYRNSRICRSLRWCT